MLVGSAEVGFGGLFLGLAGLHPLGRSEKAEVVFVVDGKRCCFIVLCFADCGMQISLIKE